MFAAGRHGASTDLNLECVGSRRTSRAASKWTNTFGPPSEHLRGRRHHRVSGAGLDIDGAGTPRGLHAFGVARPKLPPSLPFGIYSIPEIAMVGPDRGGTHQTFGTLRGRAGALSRAFPRADRRRATGLLKLLFHRETKKLLGSHHRGGGDGAGAHRAGGDHHGGDGRLLRRRGLQLSDARRVYKVAALDAFNRLGPA